jgi:hypothetical protein
MKTCGGVEAWLHPFSNSAIDKGEQSILLHSHFASWENSPPVPVAEGPRAGKRIQIAGESRSMSNGVGGGSKVSESEATDLLRKVDHYLLIILHHAEHVNLHWPLHL